VGKDQSVTVRELGISGIQSELGAHAGRFISAFEKLTGVKVHFVDTNETDPSFKAAVIKGDPPRKIKSSLGPLPAYSEKIPLWRCDELQLESVSATTPEPSP